MWARQVHASLSKSAGTGNLWIQDHWARLGKSKQALAGGDGNIKSPCLIENIKSELRTSWHIPAQPEDKTAIQISGDNHSPSSCPTRITDDRNVVRRAVCNFARMNRNQKKNCWECPTRCIASIKRTGCRCHPRVVPRPWIVSARLQWHRPFRLFSLRMHSPHVFARPHNSF